LISGVDENELLNSERLDFITEVSTSTGEFSSKAIANYHFCKIKVFSSGRVCFSGSIHKMSNSLKGIKAPNFCESINYKGFNGNLFTIDHVIEARNHICDLIGCDASQMIFENLEIGVNTTPNLDPQEYLKGLLYHRNKPFEYKYNNNFAQAIHQRLVFKIYNKSHQYGMNYNVLRVELKIMKSIEMESLGIRTFADINQHSLDKAKDMLLRRFNEVMHYDYTIDKLQLSNVQKNRLKNYSNPRYWINELKPNERYRHKIRLAEITGNCSQELHNQIASNIEEKCSRINRQTNQVDVAGLTVQV
jgi:hypothetical protein